MAVTRGQRLFILGFLACVWVWALWGVDDTPPAPCPTPAPPVIQLPTEGQPYPPARHADPTFDSKGVAMPQTYTFVLLKPDTFTRHLQDRILQRFLDKGFQEEAHRYIHRMTNEQVYSLYGKYQNQAFYPDLKNFMQSGPCWAFVFSRGEAAVETARALIGATDPRPGTIRGDFATDIRHNCVHAADTLEAARQEAKLFLDWDMPDPRAITTT